MLTDGGARAHSKKRIFSHVDKERSQNLTTRTRADDNATATTTHSTQGLIANDTRQQQRKHH